MSKTTRREMLKKVGVAGTVAAGLGLAPVVSRSASLAGNGTPENATVSFGSWRTPLDKFTTLPPPSANHHELTPMTVSIEAGGSVNFIIAGLHLVEVHADGTQPGDINTTLLIPPPPGVMLPPLINDPHRRIYRGPDPRPLLPTLDRVEVVHFANPGTYLVICSVLPHFIDGMFGFVRVLPKGNGD